MKAKEFIPVSKPRNFVAKNQKTAGAGAHKDKKRAEKQGDVKHKQKQFEQGVEEGLGKTIKRSIAGWGAFDKDKPKDVANRVKGQDTDVLKRLHEPNTKKGKGSPAELQQKAIGRELKKREQGVAERVRDPEDWDEGDTEPPNNFAVYINGKKWKVFQGRGQFADDYKEMQHFRQLQNWAQQKSSQTGKKWEVYKTGEAPTA
jgi:hypothetical protein